MELGRIRHSDSELTKGDMKTIINQQIALIKLLTKSYYRQLIRRWLIEIASDDRRSQEEEKYLIVRMGRKAA